VDLEALPGEALRRQLAALGIPRERHCMSRLVEMLPITLNGKPYEDFDADIVAEVLVYLIGKGLIAVPGPEIANLNLRWGDRVCHFYRTEDDLVALLLPYFQQGLAEGERCIWLAQDEEASRKARQTIAALADTQYSPDQLEVADANDWGRDVEAWTRAEQRSLVEGYHGLRVSGEALDLDARTSSLRVKALCTYHAERTDRAAVPTIIRSHHAALVKNGAYWQRVPTTDTAAAQTILSALLN
jgi:hypothetical protein